MEVLEIFIIVLVFLVVSIIAAIMLMLMLVFPIINKVFKTHLPTYDYSDPDPDELKIYQTSPKNSAQNNNNNKKPHEEKSARVADMHKDVPTIRLPQIDNHIKEQNLTISKIDAAAREVKQNDGIMPEEKKTVRSKAAAPQINKEPIKKTDGLVTFALPDNITENPAENKPANKAAVKKAEPKIKTASTETTAKKPETKTKTSAGDINAKKNK